LHSQKKRSFGRRLCDTFIIRPFYNNTVTKLGLLTSYVAIGYSSQKIFATIPTMFSSMYLYFLKHPISKKQLTKFGLETIGKPISCPQPKTTLEDKLFDAAYILICAGALTKTYFDVMNYTELNSKHLFNPTYIKYNIDHFKLLVSHLAYVVTNSILLKSAVRDNVYESFLKPLIKHPKTYVKELKAEATLDFETIKENFYLTHSHPKNLVGAIALLEDNKLIESLGMTVKNMYDYSNELFPVEPMILNDIFFGSKIENQSNLHLFAYTLLLDIDVDLKEYYARKSIQDFETQNHTIEEKSQILSSMAIYFNEKKPQFAKELWESYIEITKQEIITSEKLANMGGTRGTAKRLISKQREYAPREHAIFSKTSIDDKLIDGEFSQTKFLEEKLENYLGVVPTTLYLGEVHEN
jgi:hypothetical protein